MLKNIRKTLLRCSEKRLIIEVSSSQLVITATSPSDRQTLTPKCLWRDRSVCPLRPSPKLFEALWGPLGDVVSDIGFFPRAASRFHWLFFAHPRPDIFQPLPRSNHAFVDVALPASEVEGTGTQQVRSSTDNGMNNHNSVTATSPSSSTVGQGREEVVDLQRWVSVLQQVWSEVVYNDTDRRVSATGNVRLPLPRLSVRVRDFIVQLASPPQGSVVQGDAFDLCLSVRRPAQPQSPSLTSSTSLASLLQRQGHLLGYDSRGVEKLRVFVWMHEGFLITGRTNGLVEVIEDLLHDEGSKEVQADSGAKEERRDV